MITIKLNKRVRLQILLKIWSTISFSSFRPQELGKPAPEPHAPNTPKQPQSTLNNAKSHRTRKNNKKQQKVIKLTKPRL
jgi:hypothetical protein